MSIRALIAEDEAILAATLARQLTRLWPGLDIVATAPNGVAAVEQALETRPDLLFMDIWMPGQFRQVNRGTVVNMSCVAGAGRDAMGKVMLHLRNRPETPRVSPVYAHQFRQM